MKRKSTISKEIVKNKNSILNYFSTSKEELLEKGNNYQTSDDISKFNEENSLDIDIDSGFNELSPGYLVKNFNKLLIEILNVNSDVGLFRKLELDIINNYQNLSNNKKKFVLKLFVRQWKWHRFDKEKMKEFKIDIENLLSLEFVTNRLNNLNLNEKLELLLLDEIEKLMKKFNIKSPKKKKKNELIELVIKATNQKNEISNFFISKTFNNSLVYKLEKELDHLLNSTYKLTSAVRNTFSKLIVLISITSDNWDDCSHLGERLQKELFFLLQLEKGEICLPLYKVSRKSNIFPDQIALENYVIAIEYSLKLHHFLDNNKLESANQIYEEFSQRFSVIDLLNPEIYPSNPDSFLSRFSLRSLLIRVQSCGVDLMEKRRDYSRAVELLKSLLIITKPSGASETRISKSRARWYLRIVIDYSSHLHSAVESRFWLEQALADETVPQSTRMTFRARHLKMSRNKSVVPAIELESVDEQAIVRHWRKIQAPWQRDVVTGNRPRYMWREADGSTNHCFVEDFVILHEIAAGSFTHGVHGETGTFIVVFQLLFHDIIYTDVPDAFYTARQSVPLDMYSPQFRANRAPLLEQRFDWLRNRASPTDIERMIRDNWREHSVELGLATSWRLFESELGPIGLVTCLGPALVASICEKFVDNFRFWSSGMPDLVLWNPRSQHYEIVEVKGPGDRLSDKQALWITELQRMGARVTVCQVEGVSHKAL